MNSAVTTPADTPRVRLQLIGKAYSGTTVLEGVSLDLHAGEVMALTGENGAGKSTLSKILCGLTEASQGSMLLDGKPFAPTSRRDAEQHGVRMVMQELGLIPTLSVAENLLLDRLPNRMGWLDNDTMRNFTNSAASACTCARVLSLLKCSGTAT